MRKVIIEKDGPIKTVWMNRPEKRNALDSELLKEMIAALQAPVAAEDRVLVIRGKGDVFCAGLDMAERSKSAGAGEASGIEVMLRAIELCPLPVVAVVQGDAIAGGNELALHCDLVVASDKARFGMSLAQVGLAPNWFLAKKLMEVLGPVTTREMLLLGEPLPSTKLHALGLIARCVPADVLESEAKKVIDRLAANAPLSLKAMKALTVRQLEFRDSIKHDDVDALVRAAMQSQDAQEGMKARLEKRTAKFQGIAARVQGTRRRLPVPRRSEHAVPHALVRAPDGAQGRSRQPARRQCQRPAASRAAQPGLRKRPWISSPVQNSRC